MITKETIENLVNEKIQGTDCFIVEINVSPGNKIKVLLDKDSGTSISDCVQVSRHIEGNLDREIEDYELQVMSPGVDYPLSGERMYRKNVGRDVKVVRADSGSVKGKLISAEEDGIVVMTRDKERIEGRKSKQWVEKEHSIAYEDIKETKVIISFK